LSNIQSDASKLATVKEGNIILPAFLYYSMASESRSISPSAKFNPVKMVKDRNDWESSTSPAAKINKKILILGQDFFGYQFDMGDAIALVARLKNAGFTIYIKNNIGDFDEVKKDLEGINASLNYPAKFKESDYRKLGEDFNIVRDSAFVLTKDEKKQILECLTGEINGPAYMRGNGLECRFSMLDVEANKNRLTDLYEKMNHYQYLSPEVALRLVHEFYQSDIDRGGMSYLTDCIGVLKYLKQYDAIPGMLEKHKSTLQRQVRIKLLVDTPYENQVIDFINAEYKHFYEVLSNITGLNGTKFEQEYIPFLIKKHGSLIRSSGDIEQLISTLRKSGCLTEVLQILINNHAALIGNGYELANYISRAEELLSGRFTEAEGAARREVVKDEERLAYCIRVFNGEQFRPLVSHLLTTQGHTISNEKQLANFTKALEESGHKELLPDLIRAHGGKIESVETLLRFIGWMVRFKCEYLIKDLVAIHDDKISHGNIGLYIRALLDYRIDQHDLIYDALINKGGMSFILVSYRNSHLTFIDKLKGSKYDSPDDDVIPKLLNTWLERIESDIEVYHGIEALKGSSYEHLIPDLSDRFLRWIDNPDCRLREKDIVQCWSRLIRALNNSKYEDRIPGLIDKASGREGIREVIEELPETQYKERIPELLEQHISAGRSIDRDVVEVLKCLPKSVAVDFVRKYEDKVISQALPALIKLVKNSEYEDLIPGLVVKYGEELYDKHSLYQLTNCVEALKGSKYEYMIVDFVKGYLPYIGKDVNDIVRAGILSSLGGADNEQNLIEQTLADLIAKRALPAGSFSLPVLRALSKEWSPKVKNICNVVNFTLPDLEKNSVYVDRKPTSLVIADLHYAQLSEISDNKEYFSDVVTLEIINVKNIMLLKEFLFYCVNDSKIKHLLLPKEIEVALKNDRNFFRSMKAAPFFIRPTEPWTIGARQHMDEVPDHITIEYKDYGIYRAQENQIAPERAKINAATSGQQNHAGNARYANDLQNTNVASRTNSQQPQKKANKLYICPQGEGKELNTKLAGNPTYNMVNAGEVLNSTASSEGMIRTHIVKYDDITTGLKKQEYIPEHYTPVNYSTITQKQIDNYRKQSDNISVYYLFEQGLTAGKKCRLLSASASEKLTGLMANNDAVITLEKGDDDFFYATSDKNCTLSHVTEVSKIDKYNSIPANNPVKKIIEEYLAKTQSYAALPSYTTAGHKQWMEYLFDNNAGDCQHKVPAVMYKILTIPLKDVNPEDVRVTNIEGNHVKIEIKYNGQWITKDLGGTPGQLKFNDNGKYSAVAVADTADEKKVRTSKTSRHADRVVSKKSGVSTAANKSFIKPFPFTEIGNRNIFVSNILDCNKERVLVVAKDNFNKHANLLLAGAVADSRLVYYIDSPAKIDLNIPTLRITDAGTTICQRGFIADFIEAAKTAQKKPLLLVNWDAFKGDERTQLNTLIDDEASIHCEKLPALQIISLCGKKPADGSFLSRHKIAIEANCTFPEDKKSRDKDVITIDVQGFSNWREYLFGHIVLKNNEPQWKRSEFIEQLIAAQADDKAPCSFEIINLAPEAKKAFQYEYEQAKSFGGFYYNGYPVKLPANLHISVSEKPFDFTGFKNYEINSEATFDKVPSTAKLVNTVLFDQLLHGKNVVNGVYTETPGLIEMAGSKLELFITSNLSESQWYCLLHQAAKRNLELDIYAAPGVEIPAKLERGKAQPVTNKATKKLPLIYVSNNTSRVVEKAKETNPEMLDINVEDYSYQNLVSDIDFKLGEKFHDFKKCESPLITKLKTELKKGEKIILRGQFSGELLNLLHPLLIAQAPEFEYIGSNLIVVLEDSSINSSKIKSCEALNWLPETAYKILHSRTPTIKESQKIFEFADRSSDLTNSKERSDEFIAQRKRMLFSSFEQNSIIQLVGDSGVGKSSLMKSIEKDGHYKVYRDLAQLEACANDKSTNKILFLDESNIDNLHYTMFTPLKKGGNGIVLHNGKLLDCNGIKVVAAHNDVKYGGGRVEQKLFEDGSIPEIHMQDFPACYIYEEILKTAIYNKLDSKVRKVVSRKDFKNICVQLIEDYYCNHKTSDEKITVRELQEKALEILVDKYKKIDHSKELKTSGFISTSATDEVQVALSKTISIRQLQWQGLLPNEAVGMNGVLIPGDSALGKTKLIEAMLKSKNILEATEENERDSSQQLYYKIDASTPIEKKIEIICKAFEGGHVVWIDELNSCMKDGFEKILNKAMTGEHPLDKKISAKPGCVFLSGINHIYEEGRSAISPAVMHRMKCVPAKPIKEYSVDDLKKIMTHWLEVNAAEGKAGSHAARLNGIDISASAKEAHAFVRTSEGEGYNLRMLREQLLDAIGQEVESPALNNGGRTVKSTKRMAA
jgi:hypothetical protein